MKPNNACGLLLGSDKEYENKEYKKRLHIREEAVSGYFVCEIIFGFLFWNVFFKYFTIVSSLFLRSCGCKISLNHTGWYGVFVLISPLKSYMFEMFPWKLSVLSKNFNVLTKNCRSQYYLIIYLVSKCLFTLLREKVLHLVCVWLGFLCR